MPWDLVSDYRTHENLVHLYCSCLDFHMWSLQRGLPFNRKQSSMIFLIYLLYYFVFSSLKICRMYKFLNICLNTRYFLCFWQLPYSWLHFVLLCFVGFYLFLFVCFSSCLSVGFCSFVAFIVAVSLFKTVLYTLCALCFSLRALCVCFSLFPGCDKLVPESWVTFHVQFHC